MKIELNYSIERMGQNKRRLEAFQEFAYVDRVPVLYGLATRYFLHQRSIVNYESYIRKMQNIPQKDISMGCDGGELFSPMDFSEFVVPYYQRVYEQFPGRRGLHMCGKIDHLLDILRDELQITDLNGFGSITSRRALATKLGGRVRLNTGNVDPILLLKGSEQENRTGMYGGVEDFCSLRGIHSGRRLQCCAGNTIREFESNGEMCRGIWLPL